MQILIEPGAYDCANLGDVAMLQAALARLATHWPAATFAVVADNPAVLQRHAPAAQSVPLRGREAWLADRTLLGGLHQRLPPRLSQTLVAGKRLLRHQAPGVLALLLRLKFARNQGLRCDLARFRQALQAADLLVVAGQAGINDQSAQHTRSLLDLLDSAVRQGTPTALVGQGLGPLTNPTLRQRAARVLPGVDLIAVREDQVGPALLDALGVPNNRVMATGDDALELAYAQRSATLGSALGVSLRLTHATGVDHTQVAQLQPALFAFATGHNAALVPVPIALHHNGTYDPVHLQALLTAFCHAGNDGGARNDTPALAIAQIATCRVVLTGTYHAAVFALAQGIPVVSVARTPYAYTKFRGLQAQFGAGCAVVGLEGTDVSTQLITALTAAWEQAATLRPMLLATTQRLVAASHAAYDRLGAIVAHRNRTTYQS